jgi:uncharacterized tellurite resistance protein B-like protein
MVSDRAAAPADERLRRVVSGALPGADADTVSVVAACAGLLAGVAYADRDFSDAEARDIERLLSPVNGLDAAGKGAIVQALRAHVIELASVHTMRFSRTLRELADPDLRLHVLGMLVELAGGDDHLSHAEVNTLRQITRALGLTQDDYNRLQDEHRHKLGTLR